MGCGASSSRSLKEGKASLVQQSHRQGRDLLLHHQHQSHRQGRDLLLHHQHQHLVSLTSSTYDFLHLHQQQESQDTNATASSPPIQQDNSAMNQLLKNLHAFDDAAAPPRSWTEVSSVLHNLKQPPPLPKSSAKDETSNAQIVDLEAVMKGIEDEEGEAEERVRLGFTPRKAKHFHKPLSFHTVEELDARLLGFSPSPPRGHGFLLDDAMRASCEEALHSLSKQDLKLLGHHNLQAIPSSPPDLFQQFEKKCPPGGSHSVVLYTTSLRGVRRTHEDCCTLRKLLENLGIKIDERDVSMDSGFRNELRQLMGNLVGVPRLFIKGRHIGGVDEVRELHERGKLWGMLQGIPRVQVGKVCQGCGGARFVPCTHCNGSCKILGIEDKRIMRCPSCNENGLVQCSLCHD